MKYWIEGPKSGTTELVANLPGFPDNVRLNEKGEFWVAIDCCRTKIQEIMIRNPWMRSVYFRLPIPMRYLAKMAGMKMYTLISLFNEKGEIVDVLKDKKGKVMKLVSEVREANGKLWIGTVAHNHIATISYPELLIAKRKLAICRNFVHFNLTRLNRSHLPPICFSVPLVPVPQYDKGAKCRIRNNLWQKSLTTFLNVLTIYARL